MLALILAISFLHELGMLIRPANRNKYLAKNWSSFKRASTVGGIPRDSDLRRWNISHTHSTPALSTIGNCSLRIGSKSLNLLVFSFKSSCVNGKRPVFLTTSKASENCLCLYLSKKDRSFIKIWFVSIKFNFPSRSIDSTTLDLLDRYESKNSFDC